MITANKLREILYYNPETGSWVWKKKIAQKVVVGSVAGSCQSAGYWIINIEGMTYYASRLAWLYMTGAWPCGIVDHINMSKNDDRWNNLRLASKSQNSANSKARNTIGLKGVYRIKGRKNFFSSVKVNGKTKSLGTYACPAAAHLAYIVAADKYFGDFARAA